jgi:hypothetical protein
MGNPQPSAKLFALCNKVDNKHAVQRLNGSGPQNMKGSRYSLDTM